MNDDRTLTTLAQATAAAAASGDERYGVLKRRGTLELGFYAPRGQDPQAPHAQDELYLVATGTATFRRGDERVTCRAGDVLFVAAGDTHRFENPSEDFGAWVVFWGASGGEVPSS